MKQALAIIALFFAAHQANALHYFNCSSADQKLSITEYEIWGQNPLGCTYGGEQIPSMTLLRDSVVMIDQRHGVHERDWEKTYVIRAVIGRMLIPILCMETSTPEIDFKPFVRPCTIEYK